MDTFSDSFPVLGALNLCATDEYGVDWITQKVRGWGSPSGTLSPVKKPRGPGGSWSGDSFLQGRAIEIAGTTIAPTPALAAAALDRLIDAVSLDATLLTITDGVGARSASVRRDGDVLETWLNPTSFSWSIQVYADDARKFGLPVSLSSGLPSSIGGLAIPYTVPYLIPATQVTGQLSIFNPGNTVGPVFLQIDGPVDGPIISHQGAGRIDVWSSSWAGGEGEFLLVDMEKRTALANGQVTASRSNTITSRNWFGLDPGLNTFSFAAASYDPASKLSITAIPSWE
jgi:hypothetical protein